MNRKISAFTLAEIISVIAILGVVAAMVIPSTVRRQQEISDRTKMLKAISAYERWVPQFVLENGITSQAQAVAMLHNSTDCNFILKDFKVKREISRIGLDICAFESYDGINWKFSRAAYDPAAMENGGRFAGTGLRTEIYFTPRNSADSEASVIDSTRDDKPIKINGHVVEGDDDGTVVTRLHLYFAFSPENGALYVNDRDVTPWVHYGGREYCQRTASYKFCQHTSRVWDKYSMLPYMYTRLIQERN